MGSGDPATDLRTAIVGGGVAGLACARELRGHGPVTVFDKARKPAGRISTRREGDRRFDHGAQFFTVRDPAFAAEVERMQRAGVVAPWAARFVRIAGDGGVSPADPPDAPVTRWVGTPSMSAIAGELARGIQVVSDTKVERALWDDNCWRLRATDGRELGAFEVLLVAVPAPQAVELLAGSPAMVRRLAQVEFSPCLTVMFETDSGFDPGWDAAWLEHAALAWVARNDSKPRRTGQGAWVIQANVRYSAARLDDRIDEVAAELVEAFQGVVGSALAVRKVAGHRWRYAQVERALDGELPYLWDEDLGLGACGDWCAGPRLEDAFVSGRGLARAARSARGP